MNIVKVQDNSLLQRTYVQKSKVFLLPLTGMKKDRIYKPINTYIASESLVSDAYPQGIKAKDYILIINYPKTYKDESEIRNQLIAKKTKSHVEDSTWENFEIECIFSNPAFIAVHETVDEFIYTFDLSDWKYDWDRFIEGKYSIMTQAAKDKIMQYRWDTLRVSERKKLYCYLYPGKEECLVDFAKQLNVSISSLKKVGELCDKPNLLIETFKCDLCVNTKPQGENKSKDKETRFESPDTPVC